MFRVSCIQLCSSDNVEYNLKKTKRLILKAVNQKTNFILTPEVSSKISLNKKKLLKSATSMDKDFYLHEIKGLANGKHGFHIHEYGDLTDGCMSSCSHFNPFHKNHGGRGSKERHVGDLGNITSINKLAKGVFYDNLISLDFKSKCCIVGRCVVVHKDRDDLGRGKDEESLKTGNAGKRLGCGVIGLRKN